MLTHKAGSLGLGGKAKTINLSKLVTENKPHKAA